MLTEITLENFKCFQDATTFPLSKINLLTGINGRGKSTLLQSLLLMKQSVENNEATEEISLNGSCINIGTIKEAKNKKKLVSDKISFIFNFTNGQNIEIHLQADSVEDNFLYIEDIQSALPKKDASLKEVVNYVIPNSDNLELQSLFPQDINDIEKYINQLPENLKAHLIDNGRTFERKTLLEPFSKIHYISADRLPPQEFYKRTNLHNLTMDKRGENLGSILFQWSETEVYESLRTGNLVNNLSIQTGYWLSQIFSNVVEIKIDVKDSPYIIPLKFIIDGEEFTPPNVGFGYSHVLPIIVAGLIAEEGDILIIENPEAHLHPRAQSELTKFLAKVASCGVQVFIESHSDHILNGLRIAVKQKILAPDDTKVLYFSKDKDTNENKIYYPKIDENGRIDQWKEGFFDEWDNSLLELA